MPCLAIRQTLGLLVADSFIVLCLTLLLILNAHRSILVIGADKGTDSFLGYPFFSSWLVKLFELDLIDDLACP